jgi:hypothetical protein
MVRHSRVLDQNEKAGSSGSMYVKWPNERVVLNKAALLRTETRN